MTKTQPTTAPTPAESAPQSAPAQGEPTETVMRNALCRVYEIINGSDDFDADEVNAIIKAATGNFPISREWSMGAAYKEEIVTLRQQLAQTEEERDQARQDLEERCAENDRERAAHLQAYQEACKERDAARADRDRIEWMSKQTRIDYCVSYWKPTDGRTLRQAIDKAMKDHAALKTGKSCNENHP